MASFGEETEVVTSDFWKGRGNELYKSKDYKGAIDAYSQAIALDATNASLLTNRAAAMLMVQMYKEAAADCEAAIQLEPTNAKAYFRKATAIKCLGRVDEAIVILNKGLVHDPTSATALQEKTLLTNCKQRVDEIKVLMAESKQFTMALRQLEQVAKDLGSQNYRDLNLLKIEVLLALDKTEEAYNLSNAMMKVAANGDIELLKVRAQTLYCMGDLENAIKHLQQALRSDPDNSAVRAYYRQIKDIEEKKAAGDLSFKQGEFKAAVDSYTLCLGLLKNKVGSTGAANATFTGKLYLNRATCQAKLKNHEACIKDCHQAIYLNSKYTKAYLRRAESYVALNTPENIEKGISDYEQAYELENDEDACKAIKEKVKKAKVQHKRSKRKDLYSVLGVTNEATEGEIKTAYRKMALKLHPDKQANKTEAEKAEAEKQFKACGEAYEILGDAEKKKRYDEGVEIEDMDNPHAGCGGGHGHHHGHHGGMGGMGGGPGGIDPNILFQMFMQQQGGGRR